jgi:hypothetical protein
VRVAELGKAARRLIERYYVWLRRGAHPQG